MPPTAITVLQMVEGYWGKLGEMRNRTSCEGMKLGLGRVMNVMEEVLGRASKEGDENEGDGKLVAADSCFFATGNCRRRML
jgi:hypothetical protein